LRSADDLLVKNTALAVAAELRRLGRALSADELTAVMGTDPRRSS
jgi:hypothetical protein